tara:strand:+ start:503 stop:1444 length:942 start_codon:yes stop_codon:yes gene_type:complete
MDRKIIDQTMQRWQEVVEAASDAKLVKQAIGIATDKRYAGVNMSGAVRNIEKLKKGLSDHPQVQAVLKRVNEKKKLDPVDDKANDKKFADRKDKDIDNDGDVDSSDEFLHKKRKAIDNEIDGGEKPADNAKPKKGVNPFAKKDESCDDEVSECPECEGSIDNHESDCSRAEASTKKKITAKNESVSHEEYGFGEVINSTDAGMDILFAHGIEFNVQQESVEVFEKNDSYAKRTKGATKGETIFDKYKGKGANDMADDADAKDPKVPKGGDDAVGHEDATKAGRAGKQSPLRPNDAKIGDKKVVNPVKGATGKE